MDLLLGLANYGSMRWPSQPKQKHHREVSQCLKPPRAGVVYE